MKGKELPKDVRELIAKIREAMQDSEFRNGVRRFVNALT